MTELAKNTAVQESATNNGLKSRVKRFFSKYSFGSEPQDPARRRTLQMTAAALAVKISPFPATSLNSEPEHFTPIINTPTTQYELLAARIDNQPAAIPSIGTKEQAAAEKIHTILESAAIPDELTKTLIEYQLAYEKYSGRLEEIVQLTENSPELKAEMKKMFPAIRLPMGDILPFRNRLKQANSDYTNTFANLDKIVSPAMAESPDFDRAVGSMISSVASTTVLFNQLTGIEARQAAIDQGLTVKIDPTITLSEAGKATFEQDAAQIKELVRINEQAPIAAIVTLTSEKGRYGEKTAKPGEKEDTILGSYTQRINKETGLAYAEVALIGDENTRYGNSAQEIAILHEVLGHGSSVFNGIDANNPFVNQFSPEELVDQLVREMRLLNDKKWGTPFGRIENMFQPTSGTVADWIDGSAAVSQETFMQAISNYPITELLSPIKNIRTVRGANGVSERVVTAMSAIDSLAIESKDPAVKERLGPIKKLEDPAKNYASFAEFLEDYLPLLSEASDNGNIRAKILMAGVEKYAENFEHFDHLPEMMRGSADSKTATFLTPKTMKDAVTWQNYTNIYVANALMFHLMQQGEIAGEDFRPLLTDAELKTAEMLCKIRVLQGSNEFFAEHTAYSALLGSRLSVNQVF